MRARSLTTVIAVAALAAAAAIVTGCNSDYDNGYAVALTIAADPAISDAQLASIRTFEIVTSGAETSHEQLSTSSAFRGTREERVLYRPQAAGGQLTFEILARDGSGSAVAYGTGTTTLKSGATVTARVVLGTNIPLQPDLTYVPPDLDTTRAPVISPSTVTLKRGATQAFTADLPVVWSVREPNGGTISAAGSYTAALVPGRYTVVATRADDPTVSSTATVTVELNDLVLLAGALGGIGDADGPSGATSRFNYLSSQPAVDANGVLYFPDRSNRTIRRVDPNTGATTTLAGSAAEPGAVVDGIGSAARFVDPYGVAVDPTGTTLYISECNSHVIRKLVLATGQVTTLAGAPSSGGFADSPDPTQVRFNCPTGLAFDASAAGGASLYVGDYNNARVRQVNVATGATTTLFSQCTPPGSPAPSPTSLNQPLSVVLSTAGGKRLFVADSANGRICRLSIGSQTVADTFQANTSRVAGIGVTNNTTYWFAQNVRTLSSLPIGGTNTDTPTVIAGTVNAAEGWVDAVGAAARFRQAEGLATFATTAYLADGANYAIRKINLTSQAVTTLSGLPRQPGNLNSTGSDGATARFNRPIALAVDGMGRVYVSDMNNHNIRRIIVAPSGAGFSATVTRIAGSDTGAAGGASATPVAGLSATFNLPGCLTVDGNTLWVCDMNNNALRKIDLATVDFQTSTIPIGQRARGVAVGEGGLVYFTTDSNGIFVYDPAKPGVRRLFGRVDGAANPPPPTPPDLAGTDMGFTPPPPVVDGVGVEAYFSLPSGLVFDETKRFLYVADTFHHLIRRIDMQTFQVTTLAGEPNRNGHRDGSASMALFGEPTALVLRNGGLFIGDASSHTIRRYDLATSVVSTVIGTPRVAGIKVGPAPAGLNRPGSVAVLPTGELVINSDDREDAIVIAR
jgi:hypothetical protein